VDVPNKALYEGFKMIHEKHGKTRRDYVVTTCCIEKTLGFCIEYIQEDKSTRGKIWDDKEDPTMHNKVLEGNGHPCKMNVAIKGWTHTFVLHNASTIDA
jgi:hypothetical protein